MWPTHQKSHHKIKAYRLGILKYVDWLIAVGAAHNCDHFNYEPFFDNKVDDCVGPALQLSRHAVYNANKCHNNVAFSCFNKCTWCKCYSTHNFPHILAT